MKYLAIDPRHRKAEHLEQFVAAMEDLAQEHGLPRVILPVYLRYWLAYSTLVKCGYQVDLTMVRMQKGKPEDYEDPADLCSTTGVDRGVALAARRRPHGDGRRGAGRRPLPPARIGARRRRHAVDAATPS